MIMSAIVKLATRLPGNPDTNGIDQIQHALVQNPHELRYAVIVFKTLKITTNVELEVDVPTIEVERIEYVGDTESVPKPVVDALLEAARTRLGADPLPFDETDPARVNVTWDDDSDAPVFEDDEQ